jgi:hypothetical protein
MSTKREYHVIIPIAGHAYGEITIDNIETWEPVEQFNSGNVCYCPRPWEIEVEDMGEAEEQP